VEFVCLPDIPIKCINYQQHKFANESAWLPFGHGTYLERPYMLLPIQAVSPEIGPVSGGYLAVGFLGISRGPFLQCRPNAG